MIEDIGLEVLIFRIMNLVVKFPMTRPRTLRAFS